MGSNPVVPTNMSVPKVDTSYRSQGDNISEVARITMSIKVIPKVYYMIGSSDTLWSNNNQGRDR